MDSQVNFSNQDKDADNKIPEPPVLEIDIRTMDSDLKAFKQGGGEVVPGTVTKTFNPSVDETADNKASLNMPGYSGPEKGIFNPSGEIRANASGGGGYGKIIFSVVIILAVIIGLGLAGYYFVFPALF